MRRKHEGIVVFDERNIHRYIHKVSEVNFLIGINMHSRLSLSTHVELSASHELPTTPLTLGPTSA